MRIIGIDPGLRKMGWGVIETVGSKTHHIANGACASVGEDLSARLLSLHEQLTAVFTEHRPNSAAVEQTFVNKDGAATLKLGQARAICLLVPAQFGLTVGEYAPNSIKKAVVGVGHADKTQVTHMVRIRLGAIAIDSADAADALAIALCHAQHSGADSRLSERIARADAKYTPRLATIK